MSFMEWFFPEQAHASRIRDMERRQALARRRRARQKGLVSKELTELQNRVENLEDDLGFVSLLLASIIGQVEEKGLVTSEDIRQAMGPFDEIDGVADGRLDIHILRGLSH